MLPNASAGVINKNLSWEETNQYDVGLDISLLDYRFKVNLDYYYRYTKGQLKPHHPAGKHTIPQFPVAKRYGHFQSGN